MRHPRRKWCDITTANTPRSHETPNPVDTASADKNDLEDFLGFLGVRGLDWRDVRLEDVSEFVAWHTGGNVRVAPDDGGLRSVT